MIWEKLKKEMSRRTLVFRFIDPEKPEYRYENADALLIGGSLGFHIEELDKTILKAKRESGLPVIIFPGNVSTISRHADAILFLSLLNSRSPYWITQAQALGAPIVKAYGLEPIPTAYLVIEPGGVASWIADAKPIPRNSEELVYAYALSAKYSGFELICLDSGFSKGKPIPKRLVKAAKRSGLPVLVMGGINERNYKRYLGVADGVVIGIGGSRVD